MLVYVLDYWEGTGSDCRGTRPWREWYSDAIPSEWDPIDARKLVPVRGTFCTPAVVIAHWSYVQDVCRAATEQELEALSSQADVHVIVVSGGALPRSGPHHGIYYRPINVGVDIDDPFGRYLCEFLSRFESKPEPDFDLLGPEPAPTALMEAEMAMFMRGEFPIALSQEAKRQCLRIIERGNGRTALSGADVEWLKQADWPGTFLVNDESRRRFRAAVATVRSSLANREGDEIAVPEIAVAAAAPSKG